MIDRGHDLSGRMWTARLLRDAPQEIAAVHAAYFAAGAQVATTASYQADPRSIDAELITESVRIARRVRDELAADGVRRLVAASVGPYGAVLADGSEYRGRYGLSAARLRDFHRPRLELLAAGEPDLIAVETIPDLDEAVVVVELLGELDLPGWLSYTIEGSRTRAGQRLEDAFAVAQDVVQLVAVGVNCCRPADALPALEVARSVSGKPVIAYPNAGEDWDPLRRRWVGANAFEPRLARAWVAAGASYVGGCCRVGPSDIAALADVLE